MRNVDWDWKPPSTYQGVLLVFIGDESNDGKGGKEGKGGFEPMETEELVESKVKPIKSRITPIQILPLTTINDMGHI